MPPSCSAKGGEQALRRLRLRSGEQPIGSLHDGDLGAQRLPGAGELAPDDPAAQAPWRARGAGGFAARPRSCPEQPLDVRVRRFAAGCDDDSLACVQLQVTDADLADASDRAGAADDADTGTLGRAGVLSSR